MGRKPKNRTIVEPPRIQSFKPAGIPRRMLDRVTISIDEFEALRLADRQGLDHAEASERMGISRTTFTRLIEKARAGMAEALVEGKEVYIDGGAVHFNNNIFRCGNCGNQIRMIIGNPGPQKCPECGSMNLMDLAREYGHGPCCPPGRGRRRRGRRGRGGSNQ